MLDIYLFLSFLISITKFTHGSIDCNDFKDCLSCVSDDDQYAYKTVGCVWNSEENNCESRKFRNSRHVLFENECALPLPVTNSALENWMRTSWDAIKDSSLLDLSLPGTHDTFTYDLSLKTSDGGVDGHDEFAEFLHDFSILIPNGIENFIREQAITQKYNITGQLTGGVRFIDFRIMKEYDSKKKEWRSLHFLQSNKLVLDYMKEIRTFVDTHPQEVVVLWLSKHGSACSTGTDAYPNLTPVEKQAFFQEIIQLFQGVLTDFSVTKLNETSIANMVKRSHRVSIYAADYEEFTGYSKDLSSNNGPIYALDGCMIDNHLGPSVEDIPASQDYMAKELSTAESTKALNKAKQGFYLMSMAAAVPIPQYIWSALYEMIPRGDNSTMSFEERRKVDKFWKNYSNKLVSNEEDNVIVDKDADGGRLLKVASRACVKSLSQPPGMRWCPPTLLDVAQFDNYYRQLALERVHSAGKDETLWDFPHAIYLNGVDREGTIRTGTTLLWGRERSEDQSKQGTSHATTAYAYAPSIVLYNIQKGCGDRDKEERERVSSPSCEKMAEPFHALRKKYPIQHWHDPVYGRLLHWP